MSLIILSIWTVSSSAFSVDYEGKTYDFGDIELLNYTIAAYQQGYNSYSSSSFITIFTSDTPFYSSSLEQISSSPTGSYIYNNSETIKSYAYSFGSNSVSSRTINLSGNTLIRYADGGFKYSLIYSTHDIYTSPDGTGDLVFQRPVLTLAEVLEEAKPVETFQTTMSGIIVSLTVFLVGLVAFWKAWSFLSKNLRKA